MPNMNVTITQTDNTILQKTVLMEMLSLVSIHYAIALILAEYCQYMETQCVGTAGEGFCTYPGDGYIIGTSYFLFLQ